MALTSFSRVSPLFDAHDGRAFQQIRPVPRSSRSPQNGPVSCSAIVLLSRTDLRLEACEIQYDLCFVSVSVRLSEGIRTRIHFPKA